MTERNFSMRTYWNKIAADRKPQLSFSGTTKEDWEKWKEKAYEKYLDLLGEFPQKVDLNAEVEYSVEDDGLIRERVVFDSEEYMSVPCQVLRPIDMKADKSNPAILCSHGHGKFAKKAVSGMRVSAECEANIKRHNYNYGEQMARAGFLTISPDLRGFGERKDFNQNQEPFPGRDSCNVNFLKGAIMELWTLTGNIWDMQCCIDYLETRPEVDPERIGMMGLSQGGTMTTFTTAVEPRIKAADIICYVNSWKGFGIRDANLCGSQIVPGIYKYLDTDDIAGLIAPRPLLIEMGIYDTCFYLEDTTEGFARVQNIYKAAGVEDKLWQDLHSGPHAFGGNKAFDFFKKYL